MQENKLPRGFIKVEQGEQQPSGLQKGFIKVDPSEKKTLISKNRNPEEKYYVILIRSDEEDLDHTWIECYGRTNAYDEAKSLAIGGVADLKTSIVLVEGNGLENSVTLLYFLHFMSTNVFKDQNFNVLDYSEPEEIQEANKFDPTRPDGASDPLSILYGDVAGTDI